MTTSNQTAIVPEPVTGTGVFRVQHRDESHWPISTTIVFALSSLTGIEPTAMLPLHRAVDPAALEYHVADRDREAELNFEHHGYRVTVRGDGTIELSGEGNREAASSEFLLTENV